MIITNRGVNHDRTQLGALPDTQELTMVTLHQLADPIQGMEQQRAALKTYVKVLKIENIKYG